MFNDLNFHKINDLNCSNSTEKEMNDINDILTDDLLTYSEDKSQSIINTHQINDNNRVIDNHNQSLKNIIPKTNNFIEQKNLDISQKSINNNNFNNEIKKYESKDKEIKKDNNDINNGNNKDLSSLQISLSNLLSDVESKENTIINHNKMRGIFNNHMNKLDNDKYNCFIDISSENPNLNLSNNNTNNDNTNNDNTNNDNTNNDNTNNNNTNNNNTNNVPNNININNKIKNIHNEEQSSAFSVCNYSRSSVSNNNQVNNNNNKINAKSIGNNYIINTSDEKNTLKNNKEQNIINHRNSKGKMNDKKKNKKVTKKELNQFQINNNNYQISPCKQEYQIEKGENIELSIFNNINKNLFYTANKTDKYNNNLSINKEYYFTINNYTLDSNLFYNVVKKNNTTSIEIIKEENKLSKQNSISKNKIKLINNKNIDIQKDESKKFFYNPKINNNSIKVNYLNKDQNIIKTNNKKIRYYLNLNNKTELSHNKDKDKKTEIKNFINMNSDNKKNNYYNTNKNKTINSNYFSYHHKNAKSSQSYSKNTVKKEAIKKWAKKLFYINKNRTTFTISNHNSHNNSCNKKDKIVKVKNFTRNIELNEISSKYNNSVTYNNKNINGSKSKSKSKQKSKKMMKKECITEPSKQNNKKYFYDSHRNTNIITNNLIYQIKSAQKKTTNKLLNKLNTMNNINININKKSLFPLFSKVFEKKLENSHEKKKTKNKTDSGLNKNSIGTTKNKKLNKVTKSNKSDCFTEDINIIKQKIRKNNGDNNSHKKIKTQINLVSLLNNFNKKDNRKNNKSLYNFGNIFFINQSQILKKDSDSLSNNINDKNGLNKDKIFIINNNDNNDDNSKLNYLNHSIIKPKIQIINNFSNYKKKGYNFNVKNMESDQNIIKNNDILIKPKRMNTDINCNINLKRRIKDSCKLKKLEGDNANDIIKIS